MKFSSQKVPLLILKLLKLAIENNEEENSMPIDYKLVFLVSRNSDNITVNKIIKLIKQVFVDINQNNVDDRTLFIKEPFAITTYATQKESLLNRCIRTSCSSIRSWWRNLRLLFIK